MYINVYFVKNFIKGGCFVPQRVDYSAKKHW